MSDRRLHERLRIENTRDELGMLGAALRGWRVPRAVFGRRAPHRASQRRGRIGRTRSESRPKSSSASKCLHKYPHAARVWV